MEICDFARSFVFFTTRSLENTARIQAEARCRIVDIAGGSHRDYLLAASCKAEYTYSDGPLFQSPNYDFCGVFSEKDFLILRAHALFEGDRNTFGPTRELFDRVELRIASVPAEPLPSVRDVVEATLSGRRLAARTEIMDERGAFGALLDYPVKTMNAHADPDRFQVDTGPLPFPHLTPDGVRVERFQLAYIAYNTLDAAEFILQEPTSVRTGVFVHHYSRILRMPARTTLFAI